MTDDTILPPGHPDRNEDRIAATERRDADPLPPYAFVPGGPWPHPKAALDGLSGTTPQPPPIARDRWAESSSYLRGVLLFNAGFYWEAHEVWEGLWHAHQRRGSTADVLKGLIKLAAAGVKVRQRQPHGIATHARRAAACFASAVDAGGRRQLGLNLDEWINVACRIAESPPPDPGTLLDPVARVFSFEIVPAREPSRDTPDGTPPPIS